MASFAARRPFSSRGRDSTRSGDPMSRFVIAASALPGIKDTPIAGAVRAGERVFLSGATALQPDGSIRGLGDSAAQTHAALDRLGAALTAAYAVIAGRLPNVRAVSTGLVVAGLALPEMIVQIDAEAAMPSNPPRHT